MSRRMSDCERCFPSGEHVLTLEQLWEVGVFKLPLSKTRREIMKGFERILRDLTALKVVGDLVIDGSFLTEEIDPDDLDFTLIVSPNFYETCSSYHPPILD